LGGKRAGDRRRGKCPMQTSELWHNITHSKIVSLKHYKATRTARQHMQRKIWLACSAETFISTNLSAPFGIKTDRRHTINRSSGCFFVKKKLYEKLLNRNRKWPGFFPQLYPHPPHMFKMEKINPSSLGCRNTSSD